MANIRYEIASINQRLVKQPGPPGQPPVNRVIYEVQAVAISDNLPLVTDQQTVAGSHVSRWAKQPPFAVGDVVSSPWPTKETPA